MHKVKLVKIKSNHQNLRTDEVEGVCSQLPFVGKSFILTAPPLEEGNIRCIATTEIQKIEIKGDEIDFWTLNSHYKLFDLGEIIDDEDNSSPSLLVSDSDSVR